MKIYFAGSIRGGREDADIYQEIITLLSNYGQVLTEHIGDPELSAIGETREAKHIFDRDVAWLTESDVVVAEVTTTSHGVGYEIGIAEKLGKKVLCIFRPRTEKNISAMILGNPNIHIFEYQTLDILEAYFKEYFGV